MIFRHIPTLAALLTFCVATWSPVLAQETGGSRPTDLGRIRDEEIDEASGLVAGRLNRGILWTHNDSGDSARIFAIDLEGRTVAEVEIEGAKSRDWEDIAMSMTGTSPTLYVGDIGDNFRRHDTIRVYRFAEPALPAADAGPRPARLRVTEFDTIVLTYPDGARNAETLLVDPVSGDLVIVTKGSETPEVYRASIPGKGDASVALRMVGSLTVDAIPFGDDEIEGMVGGDVSADGRFALVKSYLRMYRWAWDGSADMPFVGDPDGLPYVPEPQGEAVAIAVDGGAYYTLGEKVGDRIPHLYAYELR